MGNEEIFHPTTGTGKALLFIWDMVDISENIRRAEKVVRSVNNGVQALMHAIAFLFLALVFGALAWFFDIQSTLVGLNSITTLVVPSLPAQAAVFSGWIVLAFTLAPTLLELFTAGLAKANIKIIQLGIISFTLFDLVTDIPKSYAFSIQLWPQIELMGAALSYVTFWVFFLVWLFLSTLGFELATVIFGYITISFAVKTFYGEGSIEVSRFKRRNASENITIIDS